MKYLSVFNVRNVFVHCNMGFLGPNPGAVEPDLRAIHPNRRKSNASGGLRDIDPADPHSRRRLAGRRAGPRLPAIVVGRGRAGRFCLRGADGAWRVDPRGEPLGTDFSNFWSASKLALMGDPAAAYDMARQYAVQKQEFGPQTGFYPVLLSADLSAHLLPAGGSALSHGAGDLARRRPHGPIRRLSGASGEGVVGPSPCSPFPPSSSRSATARTRF